MHSRDTIIRYIASKGYGDKTAVLHNALTETPSIDEFFDGLSLVGIEPLISSRQKDGLMFEVTHQTDKGASTRKIYISIPNIEVATSSNMALLAWPSIKKALMSLSLTGILLQALLLIFPFSTTYFLDFLPPVMNQESFILSVALFFVCFIAFILLSILQSKQVVNLEIKIKKDMLYRLTKHYNDYPLSRMVKKPKSYFAQKLQALVKIEEVMADGLLGSILSGFSFIVSLVLLAFMFPMITLALSLLIVFFVSLAVKQAVAASEKRRWQVNSEMSKNNGILEYIDRYKYILYSDAQAFMEKRTAPKIDKDVKNFHAFSSHEVNIEWICGAFKYSAYAITSSIGLLMYVQNAISLALVFTLLFYQTLLVQAVSIMIHTMYDAVTLRPDWVILHNFIRKSYTASQTEIIPSTHIAPSISLKSLTIHVENATLTYPDVEFHRGKYNVITGASGCGKSTLLRAIIGEITPEEGAVFFNACALNKHNNISAQQAMISLPQNQTLMYGTILENVTNWRIEIDWDDYINALKAVNMLSIIKRFDNQHMTHVDHSTTFLSGGEIQRLLLARIIYSKAPVVLLDEATSALDSKTERKIIRHIKRQKRTIIAVAHRQESIALAENLYSIA